METQQAPRIYPTLRYDDATAAIRFLSDAFGFRAQEVNEEPEGQIGHALMTYDSGVVMLSSRRPTADQDPFDQGTACTYVAVDDPDAHFARAKSAGAEIVMELVDQPYGSREYAAQDLEGNVWVFGTYRPTVGT